MGTACLKDSALVRAAKLDINSITSEELDYGVMAAMVDAVRELDEVECPLVHRFGGGVYIRQITIPAGTCVVGKIHLTEHYNHVVSGHILVVQSDGVKLDIDGPYTYLSGAYTQKTGYAVKDTIWQTIHPTTETDPDVIMDQITAFNESEMLLKLESRGG